MLVLGDLSAGRDNNLNLVRFCAATAVLVSHAWIISLGRGTVEPLTALTGHSLGSIAVFVFFAISGFLVTASFARRNSARAFVAARALRLFPGLFVSLVLVAFVMGPLVTELSLGAYLSHPELLRFMLGNLSLVFHHATLPGVFTTNPTPVVEGSLWTLIHEVLCYALVFLAGITGALQQRRLMTAALLLYALFWLVLLLPDLPVHPRLLHTHRLSLPFVMGAAFWHWRARLPLSGWAAMGLIGLALLVKDSVIAFPVLSLAVTYGTFWLAFVPAGRIRAFNKLGDYSYGIYIYAYPLQGLVIFVLGPMDPLANAALAFPLTLACAVLSWHIVEHPALKALQRAAPDKGSWYPQGERDVDVLETRR